VAATQARTARRVLETGNYREAAKRAEDALQLDATNKDALDVLQRARATIDAIDAAAAAARRASSAGDGSGTADALWRLMQLEPGHALVDELSGAQKARLEQHLPEARRLAAAANAEAEKATAGTLDKFREGVAAANAGEAAAKSGQPVAALRKLAEARGLFERAAAAATAAP
jgi:hypothetical protein